MHIISHFKLLCTIATLLVALVANAAEPPTEPILRIDPGEHTATIKSIAADEQGRWLVTVAGSGLRYCVI